MPPVRLSIIARWVSADPRSGDLQGEIMIEMKKPSQLDGAQIAQSLAQDWHATVADKQDSLDGATAWRIVAEPKPELQPVEALISIHGGRLYLIEGGATSGHPCHEQIEVIRRRLEMDPARSAGHASWLPRSTGGDFQ